jgi:OOP family OmpA-OmpF porin
MNTITFLNKINKHSLFAKDVKHTFSRCLLVLIGSLILMQGKTQMDKRLAMADQYYAAGEYLTAADLYGQFLRSGSNSKSHSDFPLNVHRNSGGIGTYKNKNEILLKQAESYRLANYWLEASAIYTESIKKDSVKNASSYYWLAVCQRSLGNYTAAVESLNHYLANNSNDALYNDALSEKQTLEFIKSQLSKPDSQLYHTQKINTDFGDKGIYAPSAYSRNQILLTSTQLDNVAPGANPYHNRLFTSMVSNNDLQNKEPVQFESIDSALNQGAACISADNKHLYFTQWKKENGQSISSIYVSNKTAKGWSQPQLLNSINEQGHNSKQPFCTSDGKYLYFSSDRSGGKGGFDIWYAPINEDGTTGEAVNVSTVNSSANEQAPFYHTSSGNLVFSSDRMPGMGGYDLYSAKGSVGEWKTPVNMGYPVNSSRDDIYFYASENEPFLSNSIISSDRGSECCLAIYAVAKTEKKKAITGIVMDCAVNAPLDSAKVIMRDASGKSFQAVTQADGRYSFDISDNSRQHNISVSRNNYIDKTSDIAVENVIESNWQTDSLHNAVFCLEKKFVLKVENVVTLYFDFDKSVLKDRATDQLDSIYNVMVENPTYRLQISGYTDSKGSVEYNNKLSERRAKVCADYFIKKGLSPDRIFIHSFGAMFPVEMEIINGRDNESGRAKNRRALINIDKE